MLIGAQLSPSPQRAVGAQPGGIPNLSAPPTGATSSHPVHPDPALRDLQAHALKRNLSVAVTGQPCLGAQGSADRPSWERRGPPSLGLPGAAQGPGCSRLCVSRPSLHPHLALTATESDGTPLMEQYVPCPVCEASRAQHADAGDRAEAVQYFDMEDCVLTAVEWDFISCPRHPDLPVPLQELVPELFMTDFPARYAAAQRPSRPRRLSGPRPRLPGGGGSLARAGRPSESRFTAEGGAPQPAGPFSSLGKRRPPNCCPAAGRLEPRCLRSLPLPI